MPCTDPIRFKVHNPNNGQPREDAILRLPVNSLLARGSYLRHLIDQLRYQICCLQSCCSTADEALSTAEQALALAQEAYDLAMAGGGTGVGQPGPEPGVVYYPDGVTTSPGSGATSANLIYYSRITIGADATIDELGLRLTSTGVGNFRLALYTDTGTGSPNELVSGSEVVGSLGSTGYINLSSGVMLTAGVYHIAALLQTGVNTGRFSATQILPNVQGFSAFGTSYSVQTEAYPYAPLPAVASATRDASVFPAAYYTVS